LRQNADFMLLLSNNSHPTSLSGLACDQRATLAIFLYQITLYWPRLKTPLPSPSLGFFFE